MIGMSLLPQVLGNHLTWLIMSLPSRLAELAMTIVVGQSMPSDWIYPVISSGVLVIIFIAMAVLGFTKEEF
jgi:hypothetical protein